MSSRTARWLILLLALTGPWVGNVLGETVEIVADEDAVETPTPVRTATATPVPPSTDTPTPTRAAPSGTDTPTGTFTATMTSTLTFTSTPPPPPSTPTATAKPKPRLDEEDKESLAEEREDAALEARAAREAARKRADLEARKDVGTGSADPKSVSVSRRTGFDFMLRAGSVARKKSLVQRLGRVIGSPQAGEVSYSVPKSVYVKLRKGASAEPGDRWVFLRFGAPLRDPISSKYLGVQVLHLAVGTVKEVQGDRCLVRLTQSFNPVQVGDEVKSYEDELDRWRAARQPSKLPNREILCHVSGGDPDQTLYQMNDYVVLSAGSDEGVVPGQTFQLRQRDQEPAWKGAAEDTIGKVRVVSVDTRSSIGKIVMCARPITRGIRAHYRP